MVAVLTRAGQYRNHTKSENKGKMKGLSSEPEIAEGDCTCAKVLPEDLCTTTCKPTISTIRRE